MELRLNSTFELNNGVKIPVLGLGTWALRGNEAYQAVLWALDEGYRLIDTASFYGNEKKIGEALKDSSVPRGEIFITTKVWESEQGFENTLTAFEKSLRKLKVSYIDLYLIHWPVSGLRLESWKALETLLENGRVRAIGVSNFTIRHLKELLKASKTIPTVNQVEFSPFLFQKDLLEFCKSQNVLMEAYSPLTRGRKLNHHLIARIGQKYSKTSAQILIRWGLQHGIVEIPKAAQRSHIIENKNVFDFNLDIVDMEQLDNLNENFRITYDPEIWK